MSTPLNLTDLSPDAIVMLFQLDTSPTHYVNGQKVDNGQIFYFTPGTFGDETVKFGGIEYIPIPVDGTDYEKSGQGAVPQPKLRIMNIGGIVSGLTIQLDDLVGAKVTRIRTFVKHLDGQSEADPNCYFEPDEFYINRKSLHDKNTIEFELATPFEQLNKQIPSSLITRDFCPYTYRQWVNGEFIYGTCPYAGDARYDLTNAPVIDPTKDQCAKRLTSCLARYGQRTPLPFGGFPGVSINGS